MALEAPAIAPHKTTKKSASARPASVALVINTYNDTRFLGTALDSVMAQTRAPDEIIVVDDGSRENPAAVVACYPAARLIRQENAGLAAARNTGLAAAASEAIVFLDADDLLLPTALADGLDCLEQNPAVPFAFGGHRMIGADGRVQSEDKIAPERFSYRDLLFVNRIGMHATVIYRRQALVEAGGFDPTLRRCEDYDVYLRLSRERPIATHPGMTAEYRKHDANMSNDAMDMLYWALKVHGREEAHARSDPKLAAAWARGKRAWTDYYHGRPMLQPAPPFAERIKQRIKDLMPGGARRALFRLRYPNAPPLFGDVQFGDLSGSRPISDNFGYERGTPVDRGYVEDFLNRRRGDIKGRVLEVGDDAYCRRFGGAAITRQDVLHISADAPGATIAGDLSTTGLLPKGVFDCLVLTQTLHLVYDMKAAVAEMHRSLTTGGVALVTVPGITRVDRGEWGKDWFWSLTEASARRLFAEAFGEANIEVEVHGNVYAATAFLQGLALEEVDRSKLAQTDACFPVILAVRAVKR